MKRFVTDIESNNLLNEQSIDYLSAPFKLKPTFVIHCAVIIDVDTGATWRFVGEEIRGAYIDKLKEADVIIGHNILDFDLLAIKLYCDIEYTVGDRSFGERDTFCGKPVDIFDTLVASKCLNPDRFGGHSLDEWGIRLGEHKIDWRAKALELGLIHYSDPKGAEFRVYHPEMLVYNEQDCKTNVKLYLHLLDEMEGWDWASAMNLEHLVRDIVTRQSHRGFAFNETLARENIKFLDEKMEEIRLIVEPLLPPKPMGITKAKAYCPPKIQFKKNGEMSSHMQKFIEKHNGKFNEEERTAEFFGTVWKLPMDPEVPILTTEPATVKDTTHIKGWLVELGWVPSQYKERDLTCDSKKNKLSPDKFADAVERYVEQTLASPFCKDRCDNLGVRPDKLRNKLMLHKPGRPLKVYTNPTFTVGQEKEMDPALLELSDKFPHAKLISEYLTYSHRRNSILGGMVDPDEMDEDDEFAGKGYLASDRIAVDGRIPTPADSCGAGTSRFKHRLVANIPRITSLFGENMRGMFGSDVKGGFYQMGYDFASLEAMIESHYCWRYDDEDHSYCLSLTMEKPNDVHTKTAKLIETLVSQAIGKAFPFARQSAKPVKYACAYGAMPKRVAKTVGVSEDIGALIHGAYWQAAKPLAALGEKLKEYWETTGGKKYILGLDGRKIPTRSASALINSLFQSAGVICAKRAMVLHERKMREAGLTVDFFRDDWKNAAFVQQMIAYHDEAQLEVHKSRIKWKTFKEEADAKAFRKENPTWSEVGHSDKGYYVGYTLAGELIQEAVRETSAFYKLNVTLSADYILGRNWAECH
jgi:hypothetical protein